MKKIIILSQQGDPHTMAVKNAVESESANHEVIIFERYRNDHFIDICSDNNFIPQIRTGNSWVNLNSDDISGIFWRIKPYYPGEVAGSNASWSEIFCASEWKHSLHGFYYLTRNFNWINDVEANLRMSYKPAQLKLAQDCGLNIPPTKITNYQPGLLSFYNRVENMIYKPVNSASTGSKPIFTSVVKYQNLLVAEESIAMAPGIFQKNIEKDHELRVTIVNQKIFVAKINSQESPESITDWRKGIFNDNIFEKGKITEDTQINLLEFHRKSGLTYAAYDFIVDKNGDEVFLECNPCGQWLWLEENIRDYQVSKEIANFLIGRA